MPIFERDNFRFRQYEVQSRGGLCCGISIALLTDLAEVHHEQNLILSATRSFYRAKEYSRLCPLIAWAIVTVFFYNILNYVSLRPSR